MRYNKPLFYIKHLVKMTFYNKFRFFLSVIGLFVGLFIFTTGNILMDSYYYEENKNSMQMDNNTVALVYRAAETIDRYDISGDSSIPTLDAVESAETTPIYAKEYEGTRNCSLSVNVVGISGTANVLPARYSDNEFILVATNIVKGRNINQADVAQKNNVVVINEFTEQLLFPNGDSIGKEVSFGVSIPGQAVVSSDPSETIEPSKCIVIGVVKDSYYEEQERMEYNKFIGGTENKLLLRTILYCPMTYVSESFVISEQRIMAWSDVNEQQKDNIKTGIEMYRYQSLKDFSYYNIMDRASLISATEEELEPLKLFLTAIMLALLFISGINAMSTMFFSVKERINEIGIKKALGATKLEILNQFIIEGIFMALIAAVITVAVSCATSFFVQEFLNNNMFILFEARFTMQNILLPLFVAIIYGFIFSIIPSYYGAKIKVTDSLRFE